MPWRHECGLRHRAPVSHVPKSLWDFARRAALRAGWGAGSASRGRCGYCCLLALVLGLVDEVGATPVAGALGPGVGAGIADVPAADSAALADARRSHTRTESAAGRSIACIEAATLFSPGGTQAFEAVAREDLERSPEAVALRSVATAERRVAILPAVLARVRLTVPDRIALNWRCAGVGHAGPDRSGAMVAGGRASCRTADRRIMPGGA